MIMAIREAIAGIVAINKQRIFLIDAGTGRAVTYGEFHRQAAALAADLRGRGAPSGERIAISMPNCCELAVLYFACIELGAVIVPINPALNKSEIDYILGSCKPVLVVAGESNAGSFEGSHVNVLILQTTMQKGRDSDGSGILRIDALTDSNDFELFAGAEEAAVIMYTSGTSAKPKGLAHKLERMFRNAGAFAAAHDVDQDSRFYLTLSMAYMGGFYNLLILPFLCGASVVVDHVFDARSSLQFWDKARNNAVNTLWMAPTVLSILLRMDRGRAGEEFCRSSIRHAFVGFAPLPLKVKDEFEKRYGLQLIENYGLSETLFVTGRSASGNHEQGYVGEPIPGVSIRVVNGAGQAIAPGGDGEVQILTPDLMAGYLDDDGKLLELNASDWFATGDVGHLDGQGSLAITGRKKDIIIRGGVNVSPAAIEEILMQVESVSEVAVVSIPHELYGEDIVAVLKLDAGIELDHILDSVLAHAKRNLAQHQQPARYIAIDDLPRTANGKVQKARIRELVAEKLQLGSHSNHVRPASLGAPLSQ